MPTRCSPRASSISSLLSPLPRRTCTVPRPSMSRRCWPPLACAFTPNARASIPRGHRAGEHQVLSTGRCGCVAPSRARAPGPCAHIRDATAHDATAHMRPCAYPLDLSVNRDVALGACVGRFAPHHRFAQGHPHINPRPMTSWPMTSSAFVARPQADPHWLRARPGGSGLRRRSHEVARSRPPALDRLGLLPLRREHMAYRPKHDL